MLGEYKLTLSGHPMVVTALRTPQRPTQVFQRHNSMKTSRRPRDYTSPKAIRRTAARSSVAPATARYLTAGIQLAELTRAGRGRSTTWHTTISDHGRAWARANHQNRSRRQFVFVLAGVIEVEAGDGGVRLVEDTAGRGHVTRAIGTDPALVPLVRLED